MVLFIALPFIGGFVGYVHAPEKTVETEKIIIRETPASPRIVNESFFEIEEGKLINFFDPEEIIYTFPPNLSDQLNLTSLEEENYNSYNAVSDGDLSGKYYIAVNNPDRYGSCEFSNKIYSLDTNSNQLDLLYEENSNTLSREDSRACNKEMVLLGMEEHKLVIRYHALESGGVCDRKWSYPGQTWYLDTTFAQEGTKKYDIPKNLSIQAISEVEKCVENLDNF